METTLNVHTLLTEVFGRSNADLMLPNKAEDSETSLRKAKVEIIKHIISINKILTGKLNDNLFFSLYDLDIDILQQTEIDYEEAFEREMNSHKHEL